MPETNVSVVIPTLNSAETLGGCLDSIRLNKTQYEYEIIVVDGGSADETVTIAKKYADVVLIGDTYYAGTNRNKGVKAAQGNIICFTDSDCIVPEDWVDGLVSGLLRLNAKDNMIVGVGGGNIPLLENPSLVELAISKAMRSPLVSFGARNVTLYNKERQVLHNPPMSSAYFKEILEEVGGFSEEYAYGGEDTELDAKITERGYKLYYIPGSVIYHKHRSDFKKFARQMYAFGEGKIRVGRKFKKYLPCYHYGPALLYIMTYSPLFFIPFGMGVINGLYVSCKERNPKLFCPLVSLTMTFYVNYGRGEIAELRRKRE